MVTGLEALGRSQELQKITTWLNIMNNSLGPNVVAENYDVRQIGRRIATAIQLDDTGLAYSDEYLEQRAQQQQQQMLQQQVVPEMAKAGGKVIENQLTERNNE